MSTDYFPDKEVKISEFLKKKKELKSHGITIEKIDGRYRLKLDVPDNVSTFDIWKECFGESKDLKDIHERYSKEFGVKDESMESFFETLGEIYKQEVFDQGYRDGYDYIFNVDERDTGKISKEKLRNILFLLHVPMDTKFKSNYMWLSEGHRNKDIIDGVTRYGTNTDSYLVKLLEKVIGFNLISEHTYQEVS